MVDAVISFAIEKLNKILEDEVGLLVGVTKELRKLSSAFTAIKAVLEDAETQSLKQKSVMDWLEKLKDVAYDIDDILDEWTTESLRSQGDEGDQSHSSNKKVQNFLSPFSCFGRVALRHRIANKIKDAWERLELIEREKNGLHLKKMDNAERRQEIGERETSSQVDKLMTVGRDDERNEIVKILLNEMSSQVNEVPIVISIVGMGGVGKTTLAQLAYNDEDVKQHFDKRMWVCVSEHFDVKQITKSILESAAGSPCEYLFLEMLQSCLREELLAKRFLLVLDDVWSNDSEMWDKLRLPFQAGAQGSRIVVTTRREDVACAMGSTCIHKLAVLSDDDCWLLFNRRALEHRSAEERSELEDIGRQIVKKCGGVPLAAKTIGSAMRFRRTRSQWVDVLGSDIWNSGDVLGSILPALLLSYHDLPPALKQCFAYFSIFPKDCVIWKENIARLWMAQGFIRSNGSEDMEETGGLYFDDLLRRSLLQDAEIDSNGNILGCKMHNLVHDLAQSVAGSNCSIVVIRQQALLDLNNAHHSHLCFSDEVGKVPSIPATLYKARKLRTLLLDYIPPQSRISRLPHDLFHQLRRLRALKLSHTDIVKLPRTVGQLKHLRHLDLSSTGIEELPEEVSNCINLQALILNDCGELRKLPRGMRKMISLRLLEFNNCDCLRYLPQGIGRLTALQKITKFIVGGGDEGCKCGELRHLNHLKGILEITGLENVRSRDEAREAELDKKQHIHALDLSYRYQGGEPLDDDELMGMDDVLQNFQPHTNLKRFELWNYQGSKFPKWIEHPTFSNLVVVRLGYCGRCKQLPGLGKLLSLKHLDIYEMKEVTYVGGEFTGDDNNDRSSGGVSFPKLETLLFNGMPNWEEWELRGGDGQVMPSLLQLELRYCQKLEALHYNLLPFLQRMTLHGINDRLLWGGPLPVLPNLIHVVIGWIDELISLPGGWLGQLKALQTLEIKWCPQLGSLPEELGQLKALQTLEIEGCPQLGSLPELGQLKALQTLQIGYCPQLGSLPEELEHLTMLQQLQIEHCQNLKALPHNLSPLLQKLTLKKINNGMLLRAPLPVLLNLNHLVIGEIDELASLPGAWLGQLKALQTLEIRNCPKLGSLPEELKHLTMLQQVYIVDCPLLDERCQDGGEDWDKIAHIPRISITS